MSAKTGSDQIVTNATDRKTLQQGCHENRFALAKYHQVRLPQNHKEKAQRSNKNLGQYTKKIQKSASRKIKITCIIDMLEAEDDGIR